MRVQEVQLALYPGPSMFQPPPEVSLAGCSSSAMQCAGRAAVDCAVWAVHCS